MVSLYAEPEPIGSNRVVFSHALRLKQLGYDVEILTWTKNSNWRGPIPDKQSCKLAGRPCLTIDRCGLRFHVAQLPDIWAERVPTESEWAEAVAWGTAAIRELRPDILHQQFWQNMWWMMEASTGLNVPTLYSLHDYGIACLRTLLVKGDGSLCDAKVEQAKCSACIYEGRNSLGKANEVVANMPFGSSLLSWAYGVDATGPLARLGGLRMPLDKRLRLTIERCKRVLPKLASCIVANPLAGSFLEHLGADPGRTHVIPWFHDLSDTRLRAPQPPSSQLTLAFVGRVSQEKGLHLLLDALARLKKTAVPVKLRIAGSYDNEYGQSLRVQYPTRAGSCELDWLGWFPHASLSDFYAEIHAAVVPSTWYDNCPASLIEAVALGRPIICTDVASMTHIVKDNVNGLVFPVGNVEALKHCIERLANNPDLVPSLAAHSRNVPSLAEYAERVATLYSEALMLSGVDLKMRIAQPGGDGRAK